MLEKTNQPIAFIKTRRRSNPLKKTNIIPSHNLLSVLYPAKYFYTQKAQNQ